MNISQIHPFHKRPLILLVIMLANLYGNAQQNNTLYFMYAIPESNFLNPAVQGKCETFVGLPVISSVHMNIANSGFVAGDAITLYTDNTFDKKSEFNTSNIHGLNYALTEFHTTLFAVGMQRRKNYYTFTITEKDNGSLIYTRDLVTFILRGSGDFEGHAINLKGMNVSFNHYREYAFGISKTIDERLMLGIKAKLLFGKFNFVTGSSSFDLFVQENTQDIVFTVDGGYNSSVPFSMRMEAPGVYRFYGRYDAPLFKHLMNPRNPGIAVDAGFIYKYTGRLTLSGSLLDLGFIYYLSNLTNYSLEGTHTYHGPFGSGTINEAYLYDVFDALNQNMNVELNDHPYPYFLDPKLYLGAAYSLNNRMDLNFLLYNRLLPRKLQTGFTISLLAKPSDKIAVSTSWSYMNKSFTNLGFGASYGKKPLQLYLVSDNIFGFILPFSAKDLNLRFGINLFLGCRNKSDLDQCGCAWLRDDERLRLRIEKTKRNRKTKGN